MFSPLSRIRRDEGDRMDGEISAGARFWRPFRGLVLPIETQDLPHFRAWIEWSGYGTQFFKAWHPGYDFAAYMTDAAEEDPWTLGLPEGIDVRAVAGGRVLQVWDYYRKQHESDYSTNVTIAHSRSGGGLSSRYIHLKPSVKAGQLVEAGEKIGEVCGPYGKIRRLCPVHLHLDLYHADDNRADPAEVFDGLSDFRAVPQRKMRFKVEEAV
jgi:hypothetical protein